MAFALYWKLYSKMNLLYNSYVKNTNLIVLPFDLYSFWNIVLRNNYFSIYMGLTPVVVKILSTIILISEFSEEFTSRIWQWQDSKLWISVFLIHFFWRCNTKNKKWTSRANWNILFMLKRLPFQDSSFPMSKKYKPTSSKQNSKANQTGLKNLNQLFTERFKIFSFTLWQALSKDHFR